MAGTYAHFMVTEKARDELAKDLSIQKRYVLDLNSHIVLAGAVAPDYPYLSLTSSDAKKWADCMHYTNTNDMVCAGFDILRKSNSDEALAWYLGYVSHVVVDVVVHPIVNLIVGPYEENKTAHRLCEMTQDSFIFKEVKNLEVTKSEYIDLLRNCSQTGNASHFHPGAKRVWHGMFKAAHKDLFVKSPPDIDSWHWSYISMLDKADERIAFSRHITDAAGSSAILYRHTNDIPESDREKYIADLPVPNSKLRQTYNMVFKKATTKVVEAWRGIFEDLADNTGWTQNWFKNWNLDTGKITGEKSDAIPYFWK